MDGANLRGGEGRLSQWGAWGWGWMCSRQAARIGREIGVDEMLGGGGWSMAHGRGLDKKGDVVVSSGKDCALPRPPGLAAGADDGDDAMCSNKGFIRHGPAGSARPGRLSMSPSACLSRPSSHFPHPESPEGGLMRRCKRASESSWTLWPSVRSAVPGHPQRPPCPALCPVRRLGGAEGWVGGGGLLGGNVEDLDQNHYLRYPERA